MIIVRSMGGLGNQFFQYALYLQLSRNFEASFDVSWHAQPRAVRFQLDQFNAAYSPAQVSDVARLSDTSPSLLGRVKKHFLRKPTHFCERQDRYNGEIFSIQSAKDRYLDGYWQSYKYFPGVATEVRDLFFPVPARRQAIDALKARAGERTTVSIHVRRGDYLNNGVLKPVNADYYSNAMAIARERVQHPLFVVCSDDLAYARSLFPGDGFLFVDWNRSALDDLYTMASCDHSIIANSSFSWWGAFFLPRADKLVVYPRDWFKKIPAERTAFMFPEGWVGV